MPHPKPLVRGRVARRPKISGTKVTLSGYLSVLCCCRLRVVRVLRFRLTENRFRGRVFIFHGTP